MKKKEHVPNSEKNKLNLGCGRDYRDGFLNLDVSREVGADMVGDFVETYPWPLDDDQFVEVIANNSLTQIEKSIDFVNVMNELWRVTMAGGIIRIRVPNAKDICAWQDPMDCRRFTDQSFTYVEDGHRRYEQYGKHYGFKPFHVKIVSDNGHQLEFELCPIK